VPVPAAPVMFMTAMVAATMFVVEIAVVKGSPAMLSAAVIVVAVATVV
jgi:hypothetical protein